MRIQYPYFGRSRGEARYILGVLFDMILSKFFNEYTYEKKKKNKQTKGKNYLKDTAYNTMQLVQRGKHAPFLRRRHKFDSLRGVFSFSLFFYLHFLMPLLKIYTST